MTVHVPRRPYARMLPGIPTIRMFEALACGVPLVSAPWDDREHLFTPGEDYLVARDGVGMRRHLRRAARRPRVAPRIWPSMGEPRSSRVTAARSGSTNCWRSAPHSAAI